MSCIDGKMLACITPEECKQVEIAVEELWNAQKKESAAISACVHA